MFNKKLGYYTVNGIEFASKVEACVFAERTKGAVKWHFNDFEFDNYPWFIEPSETLDELYDKRSRQIREKYDYVIISYSGGSDSHNIVQSFIRQGLHIDELIINNVEKGSKPYLIKDEKDPKFASASNAHLEYYLQTIPRLKELSNTIPKTKITVLDMTDNLFDLWGREKDDASWVLDKKECIHPFNTTRYNYVYFDDVKKKFDKEKSIGIVFGIEKPRAYIHSDGNFYLRIADRALNVIGMSDDAKKLQYDNCTVEAFYWSPEALDILCKQAHILRKWLEITPQMQQYWFHKNMSVAVYKLVHERTLRSIIYNSTWNDSWWQADKPINDWYCEFDNWWMDNFKGTKTHNVWLEGIKYVIDNASSFVKENKDGMKDGLQVFSKTYKISKFNSTNPIAQLEWSETPEMFK